MGSGDIEVKPLLDRLNALIDVGTACTAFLEPLEPLDLLRMVLFAFAKKTTRLLEAVRCLLREGFDQEAQILARTLVELDIDFLVFVRMSEEDKQKAVAKVLHAVMLDKLKALRASDFHIGDQEVDRAKWEAFEDEIKQQYLTDEFEALKRFGFSGMSIEGRARKVGREEVYNLMYRLYSRSTHFGDLLEHLVDVDALGPSLRSDDALFPAVVATACESAASLFRALDKCLGGPFSGRTE